MMQKNKIMKKNIIAVGGQGFIKECFLYIQEMQELNFKGVLSIGDFKPDFSNIDIKFLGNLLEYTIEEDDYFLICAGKPSLRKEIYTILKERNVKFYNLIYKTNISNSVNIGEGNIFINCEITSDITIGNGNLFNSQVIIGHDVNIGNYNFISPRTCILGGVKIGSGNSIGTMSCLLPNSKIGDENIIAPGSFIYKGCKNRLYYSGNPAVKIGKVESL